MPNEQLLTYVRERLATGVERAALTEELVKAGWKSEDVALAMDTAVSTSAATTQPVPQTNSPATIPEGKLPGVFALVGAGFNKIRERAGVLASIILIQSLPSTISSLGMNAFTSNEATIKQFFLSAGESTIPLVIGLIVSILAIIVLFCIIFALGVFAMMHAIASAEPITAGEAYRRAWHQFRSLLWVGLLTMVVVFGAFTIALLIPIALWVLLEVFGGAITSSDSMFYVVLFLGFVCFVSYVTLVFQMSIYTTFAGWLVVAGKSHGIGALAESKKLVQGYFWAILRRVLGISFLLFLFVLVLYIPIGIASAYASAPVEALSMFYQAILNSIILVALFATMYPLYEARSLMPVSTEPPKGRGVFITYAIVGLLGIIAIPVLVFSAAVVVSSLMDIRNKGTENQIPTERIAPESAIMMEEATP